MAVATGGSPVVVTTTTGGSVAGHEVLPLIRTRGFAARSVLAAGANLEVADAFVADLHGSQATQGRAARLGQDPFLGAGVLAAMAPLPLLPRSDSAVAGRQRPLAPRADAADRDVAGQVLLRPH